MRCREKEKQKRWSPASVSHRISVFAVLGNLSSAGRRIQRPISRLKSASSSAALFSLAGGGSGRDEGTIEGASIVGTFIVGALGMEAAGLAETEGTGKGAGEGPDAAAPWAGGGLPPGSDMRGTDCGPRSIITGTGTGILSCT